MWISKKKYDDLVQSRDFWQKAHDEATTHRLALLHDLDRALTSNDVLQTDNQKLLEQVEVYKQKYADEVQKRLELVKLLENTP